jgi:tRNA U34 5-methylaminomethyl-2-thiouridine-forming methyltransferase MnmC
MIRQIIQTNDGSSSISIPEKNVTYHSIHGAVQESMHVFINAGWAPFIQAKQLETIYIFEMGLGTGLNALLTFQQAILHQQKIHYTAIELFPLTANEVAFLNYENKNVLHQIHNSEWGKDVELNEYLTLHKTNASLINYQTDKLINLIYYDAFAPSVQPELWSKEIFEKLFFMLDENGILVTYCSKGDVRRAMLAAGFSVEKLQGPPHKREILRAKKMTENR